MNIILLGAPGSGKGTQAELIAKNYNLKHISGGESLRKEVESGSRKGEILGHIMESGELVPFATISSVIEPVILENKNNFILDGTPRDLAQAEYLETFFVENKIIIDHIFYLYVPEEKLVERLLKRAEIENRADDTLESIRERFVVFHSETEPVLDHFKKNPKYQQIDGDKSVEEIAENLRNIIGESLWLPNNK